MTDEEIGGWALRVPMGHADWEVSLGVARLLEEVAFLRNFAAEASKRVAAQPEQLAEVKAAERARCVAILHARADDYYRHGEREGSTLVGNSFRNMGSAYREAASLLEEGAG